MSKRKAALIILALQIILAGCSPSSSQEVNTFIGPGSDWSDPANWIAGNVPDSSNSERIVIEPGTELVITNDQVVANEFEASNAVLLLKSSCIEIKGEMIVAGAMTFNPSCLITETLILQGNDTVLDIGLGGIEPANPDGRGIGHFAHIGAEEIQLDGQIKVSFYYDFKLEAGQVFEIISASRSRIGEFTNAGEGDIVGGNCDVTLRISYLGGDGDDVILSAEKVGNGDPKWPCSEAVSAPAIIATATSTQFPQVTAERNANCRAGPATAYNEIGFLAAGEIAEVLGQNGAQTWAFVRLSNARECWVWGGALTEDSFFTDAETLPDPYLAPTATLAPPEDEDKKDTSSDPKPTSDSGSSDASISGTVFKDANGDGSNNGDAGYGGVSVKLGAGACNSSGLASTSTSGNGGFSFGGLSAGSYCLTVVTPSSGSCPRWDHASTNTKFTINLSAGQSVSKSIGFDNSACSVD